MPSPEVFDTSLPTQLVVFATPNGNTAEQTLGCRLTEGLDWHYDIQHIAAQWRTYQHLATNCNTVLACLQSDQLSWPSWKAARSDGPATIAEFVFSLRAMIAGKEVSVVLCCHSGGGSFLFGFLDAHAEIPSWVERICFLDANYSYESSHGEKLQRWLDAATRNTLFVLAYDDRNIELNGKKVVGPTGGTYRATDRMLQDFRSRSPLKTTQVGQFDHFTGNGGRLAIWRHHNPENLILHTRLVGEMNGLLEALTCGTPLHGTWGNLAPPQAYESWIQEKPIDAHALYPLAPALPPRSAEALSGSQIAEQLLGASPQERESRIMREILSGNAPEFLRDFKTIRVERTLEAERRVLTYRVMPDYLAVGSDDDFIRIPLTPYVAQHLADMLGCTLPTCQMVDDINRAASVKLSPQPLTEARDALATFVQHNTLIEEQRGEAKLGELVAGIKKDVVLTNRLQERPSRVAIYGWHKLDGTPIQPLTIVHVDWYVDYSHGIRLIDRWATLDGKPIQIAQVLSDATLAPLLSDEGPLQQTCYRPPANGK